MELIPLLCLLFGATSAQEIRFVNVPEGEDALLPCTLNSGHSIDKFDWRKDNGKENKLEVFLYRSGSYYGHGLTGQHKQFEGRVDFFKDELKSGNASIIIRNTRLEDNGTYTCGQDEPHGRVPIRLNVGGVLKIRNCTGAVRRPYIETRDKSTWNELKCTVEGIPKPEIEWRNSVGKVLSKYIPKNEDGPFRVELKINVTTTDNYTCVATQWDFFHQVNNTQEVTIPVGVAVSEGDDAVLPCSFNSNQNIKSMKFYWSKAKREVFSYDRGIIEEDQQFRGRLTHFEQGLGSGNASIKIYNTQKSDSGRYTCHFPDIQKSHFIELYVVEHSTGLIVTVAVITVVILLLVLGSIIAILSKKIHSLKEVTSRPPESYPLNHS